MKSSNKKIKDKKTTTTKKKKKKKKNNKKKKKKKKKTTTKKSYAHSDMCLRKSSCLIFSLFAIYAFTFDCQPYLQQWVCPIFKDGRVHFGKSGEKELGILFFYGSARMRLVLENQHFFHIVYVIKDCTDKSCTVKASSVFLT